MGDPVTLDMSTAQPIQAPPVTLDMSTAAPINAQPSAASRFGNSFASGAGVVSNEQGKNFFVHPLDTLKAMADQQGALGERAGNELKNKDYVRGLTHGIEWLIPGVGPVLAHAGDQGESGDIAGMAGTTLGVGANILAGKVAPGVTDAAAAKISSALDAAKQTSTDSIPGAAAVRATARGVNTALEKAPGVIGGTIGAGIGLKFGGQTGAELGGLAGTIAGKEILPQIRVPGEGFGFPNRVTGGPPIAPQFEEPPIYPGGQLPEHPGVFPGGSQPPRPAPELIQANALARGGAALPPEPASALAGIPQAKAPGAAGSMVESVAPESRLPAAFQPLPPKPAVVPGTVDAPFKLADLPPQAVQQAVKELGPKAAIADVVNRAAEIALPARGAMNIFTDPPLIRGAKVNPTAEDLAETQAIQERVRNASAAEQQAMLREIYGEQRMKNDVSTPKSVLTGVVNDTDAEGGVYLMHPRNAPAPLKVLSGIDTPAQAVRQLNLLKQAGANPAAVQWFQNAAATKFGENWQTAPSDDLTPILQQSVEAAKKARQARP